LLTFKYSKTIHHRIKCDELKGSPYLSGSRSKQHSFWKNNPTIYIQSRADYRGGSSSSHEYPIRNSIGLSAILTDDFRGFPISSYKQYLFLPYPFLLIIRGIILIAFNAKRFMYLKRVSFYKLNKKKKLHGLSPRANYTDRATAACRRSDCQLVRIEGATWSA
jgi:hypothetical protein